MDFVLHAQRRLRNPFRFAAVIAISCFAWAPPSFANTGALIVGNDRGGVIGTRAAEISRLKSANRRVEIRGNICLSSCTMYLGAGNICVSPDTRFGFHGPSYYGQPLQPEHFEYWSDIIASHYPPTIQKWFMSRARYETSNYITLRGTELIRHGVQSCQ